MNATLFRRNVGITLSIYGTYLALGIALWLINEPTNQLRSLLDFWKDCQNLVIAMPAAWLSYCFQLRHAYIKDVRELWFKIVPAVQTAIQYTHSTDKNQELYSNTMHSLSTTIEETRGVFANVGESETLPGFYPFESLKDIQKAVSALGFLKHDQAAGEKARKEIIYHWKKLRRAILLELPRGTPEFPDSRHIKIKTEDHRELQ